MSRPQGPIVTVGFVADFAARLRAAREKAKLTTAEAAERAGVSNSAWLMYESGRRFPREDLLPQIGRAVNVPYKRLLPD